MARKSALLLSIAALLATSANVLTQEVQAKNTGHKAQGHAYLVPPPPAYAPSILPELQRRGQTTSHPSGTQQATEITEEQGEVEETKTYVRNYANNGTTKEEKASKAVRQNKYVTYWNRS